MVRVAVKRVRVFSSRGMSKSLSSSELANQMKAYYSDDLIDEVVQNTRTMRDKLIPKIIEWNTYKPLPKSEEYKAQKEKPRVICTGFSNHDCEAWYKCPICGEAFGSWSIFHQEKNENGTKHYCPKCKIELSGLG